MARQSLIVIRSKKTALRLFYIAVVLFISNLAGIYLQKVLGYSDRFTNRFFYLFDAADENNVPAVFTTLILFVSSVLLFLIYRMRDRQVQQIKKYWLLLSLIFLFLSTDELVSIHEQFNGIAKLLPGDIPGYSRFAWVLLYGFLVLLGRIAFTRFLFKVPVKSRKLFILSGCTYVIAAVIFEFPEGYMAEVYGVDYKYFLLCSLEEFLEMAGIILFIYALLDYISSLKPSMQAMQMGKQSDIVKTKFVFINQSDLSPAATKEGETWKSPADTSLQ